MALRILVVTLRNTGDLRRPAVREARARVLLDVAGSAESSVQVDEGGALDEERALLVAAVRDGGCGLAA